MTPISTTGVIRGAAAAGAAKVGKTRIAGAIFHGDFTSGKRCLPTWQGLFKPTARHLIGCSTSRRRARSGAGIMRVAGATLRVAAASSFRCCVGAYDLPFTLADSMRDAIRSSAISRYNRQRQPPARPLVTAIFASANRSLVLRDCANANRR